MAGLFWRCVGKCAAVFVTLTTLVRGTGSGRACRRVVCMNSCDKRAKYQSGKRMFMRVGTSTAEEDVSAIQHGVAMKR